MSDIKRPHYFNHQFLNEQDFRDEQEYHIEMRRRHNRLLHSWGIAEGLTVDRAAERQITINPGTAYDSRGREIVLNSAVTEDTSSYGANSHFFVVIRHHEHFLEDDRQSAGGVEDYTRVTETPEVSLRKTQPGGDGNTLALARVYIDGNGDIRDIDSGVRRYATAKIGTGGITTDEIADNSITSSKLAAELRSRLGSARGWVRVAFIPAPFERVRIDSGSDRVVDTVPDPKNAFIQDIGHARCGAGGARGTMAIPVPGGARRVIGFRIAGTTLGNIDVQLFRSGWDRNNNKGQAERFFDFHLNAGHFDHFARVDQRLEDDDTLVVTVVARGESRVFLLAAEFE